MVSMWPCNFSVKLPSKVIMPKRKRETNECITTKIRWYKPLWWNLELGTRSDIRSASRIIGCLSYLVYCIVGYYVVIIFYTDLFTNLFSMLYFRHYTNFFLLLILNIEWNFIGPLVHYQFIYIKYSIANIHVMFYFPNS